MKIILFMVCTALMLAVAPSAKAQWVVTDPTNLASGILNSANEIVQTSSTVSNVIKNFKEVEKVYKQGKEYYDKLQAVNNLVKDARKVQQTVLLVGDVSEMYVQNFGKMMNDKERMDIIDRVYKEVKEYHNLVRYYTNKNISVSFLRAKKQNNTQRVLELYGTANQKYW